MILPLFADVYNCINVMLVPFLSRPSWFMALIDAAID